MHKNMFKKIKYTIMHNKKICVVFLLVLLFITMNINSISRYISKLDKKADLKVASLIIETNSQTIDTNLARGKDINHYFSISNYNSENVTEVAYDYYIFIVDENDEIINDAKIYKYKKMPSDNLITQDNPNTYVEVEKIMDGKYKNGFYGGELFLVKEDQEFKLEISNIQKEAVQIKTIAVQKNVE